MGDGFRGRSCCPQPVAQLGNRRPRGYPRGRFNRGDLRTFLQALIPLAPLHNKPALDTVELLPRAWRQQGIRRYGFHGISHHHMARSLVAATANRDLRLVSLHLGGGCSACTIRGLRCQDTSMGFTPLEGLINRLGTVKLIVHRASCMTNAGTFFPPSAIGVSTQLRRRTGTTGWPIPGLCGRDWPTGAWQCCCQ